MTLDPSKGYRALRDGRYSQAGGEYFITFCTEHRQPGLASDSVASAIVTEIKQMDIETVWSLRCAVIMPDHVHLFFQLGDKLSLCKAIARVKSKSVARLKTFGLRWQKGYFEHYMRPKEDRLPIFLYIYLNPYRAGLLPKNTTWSWFICGEQDTHWFMGYLNQGLPEPTWLADLP